MCPGLCMIAPHRSGMSCERDTQEECQCAIDGDTPVSLAVIECVSEVDDSDPETRPPLYEAIDPDALNNLFRDRNSAEVTFTYLDYKITVTSDAVTTTLRRDDPQVTAD